MCLTKDCNYDLSGSHGNKRYCTPCAKERQREVKRLCTENRRKRPEVQAYIQQYNKAYKQSEGGRSANAKYNESERGRAKSIKRNRSQHTRDLRKIYRQTEHWKVQNRNNVNSRRARKLNQSGVVTRTLTDMVIEQGYICNLCNKVFENVLEFTIDHIVPLARGGLHDDSNLQALCAFCNGSKGAKTPDEYEEWLKDNAAT